MNGGGKVIIVYKKKKTHGGHHGGSWKVAYADFVTAMMAFFMVMWIVGMEDGVKESVQGYFNNPVGFRKSFGGGINPISAGNIPIDMDVSRMPIMVREAEERRFNTIREKILDELEGSVGLESLKTQVEVSLVPEGLRIELVEGEDGANFFAAGSAALRPAATGALDIIGRSLEGIHTGLTIEGHTDSFQYGTGPYSNWELSVDRANAARRLLVGSGLPAERVLEVRGYADRALRVPDDPQDPSNRRITILVPYSSELPPTATIGQGQQGPS